MHYRAATTPAGEHKGCRGVARGQPPGRPLNLHPYRVHLVELGIPPWNQRGRVPEARGGDHVHGRHHLAQQVLVTPCYLDEIPGDCEDVLLLFREARGSLSSSVLAH